MAETIETFVAMLQADGVQAGQDAADKMRSEAQQEADDIVRQAQAKAEKIIADAEAKAQSTLTRSKTDLELAARDAAMRLRQALGDALTQVLTQSVNEALSDAEFLKTMIHDLAKQYAAADIQGISAAKIALTPDMYKTLAEWAIRELHEAAMGRGVSLDLQADLKQAGFEYSVSGGTVEVTADSVVAALAELVGPHLRGMFDKAVSGDQ